MRRFRVPEIVLGAMLGLIFSLLVGNLASLQAEHCKNGRSEQPSNEQQINSPNDRPGGEQKPPNYYQRHPISCGVGGIVPAAISYMDENEGFFVGLFTGLLFVATILLWRATNALWAAGERQIDVTKDSVAVAKAAADAADRSARTAELALLAVEVPYLYPNIRSHGIKRAFTEAKGWRIKGFELGSEFITYYFKNFGRTPADIIEVFSQIRFGMGAPPAIPIPDRPTNRLSGTVVPYEGESGNFPCDLPAILYQTILDGGFNADRDIFWFSGYVRYLDVFDNEYVSGFCFAFSPRDDKFFPMGADGYNFRRRIRTGAQIGAQ